MGGATLIEDARSKWKGPETAGWPVAASDRQTASQLSRPAYGGGVVINHALLSPHQPKAIHQTHAQKTEREKWATSGRRARGLSALP